jgi:hypothetical protein
MAEPPLDLHGVAAIGEQHGRAGVPERVEPSPGRIRFLRRGLEHAAAQVPHVQLTRHATSSTQARSIRRDDRTPRAQQYSSSATITDGSYAARPCPSARYAA